MPPTVTHGPNAGSHSRRPPRTQARRPADDPTPKAPEHTPRGPFLPYVFIVLFYVFLRRV